MSQSPFCRLFGTNYEHIEHAITNGEKKRMQPFILHSWIHLDMCKATTWVHTRPISHPRFSSSPRSPSSFLSLSKSKLINFRLYSFHFLAIIAICVRFFPLSHSTPHEARTQTHFAEAQILGIFLQRAVPLALNPEERGRESLALLFRVRGALCLPLFPFPSIVTLLP